jgi:Flp pilus assembly CpaE family ATPase
VTRRDQPDGFAVRVPILTAVADPGWESGIVSAFDRGDHGVAVVRRCVDLPDLLAAAASGMARAVLLSADLRRLDRDALARLDLAGLAVVGLVAPGDEDADRRLRQLGVRWVLAADAAAEVVAAAVVAAVSAPLDAADRVGPAAYSAPLAALDGDPTPTRDDEPPTAVPGTGRVLAVWGATGAPGRTTVAVHLAAELARLGRETALVDADVYGGTVAQVLGLLDEAPGLAAACRQANSGSLDVPRLAAHARELSPGFRVLTGITRAERWPELRPAALDVVLALARSLAEFVVVDCGFCLEQDEELAYDTTAPRRNGATLTALQQADSVLVVVAADPIGVARGIRAISELREAVPGVATTVVLNKARRAAVGGDPLAAAGASLRRYADADPVAVLPFDSAALDAAVMSGRTLAEAAPSVRLRAELAGLAATLSGAAPRAGARRRSRGTARRRSA